MRYLLLALGMFFLPLGPAFGSSASTSTLPG